MKDHFEQLAAYNRWANARLYQAAFGLEDAEYRRDVGSFFGSLHGTLNHLLVTDRLWMKRFTGEGDALDRLDAILYDDLTDLASARADEDDRITNYINGLDAAALSARMTYANTSGQEFEEQRSALLTHLFNHQTHHRGQAHTILSICGAAPPSLDLLVLQRGVAAPDLRSLAKGA